MRMLFINLIFLFSLSTFVHAQVSIDSLISKMNQYSAASPDSSLHFCQRIIDYYASLKNTQEEGFYKNRKGVLFKRMAKYPEAEQAYQGSYVLYKRIADKKGMGIALNNLGEIHLLQGEYTEAIKLHKETLGLKKELRDTFGIGASFLNLGNVYLYQSLYEEAIEEYMKASEMFLVINDSLRLSSVYNNLGALHNYIENRDKALQYWEQSLEIKKRVGNKSATAKALNNLAEMYMVKGDLDTALEYLEESLTIKKEIKDREGFLVTTYNLASCHRQRKEYSLAAKYFKKAHVILEDMPLTLHHAEFNNKIGTYYLELKHFSKAQEHFNKAKAQAEQLDAKEVRLSVADNLALTYESMGNYRKAFAAKDEYVTIRDSIQRQQQQNKILELESRYEVKSKNHQIELLQSKNTVAALQKEQIDKRNKYLLAGLVALSLISMILYGNVRLRSKNSKLLKEKNQLIQEDLSNKNMLINEIHHRIKNNLSIIDSLINVQIMADQDAAPEDILRSAQNRIKSISRLHDLLYQNQLTQDFNLENYLKEICEHVLGSYNDVSSNIALNTQIDQIKVPESDYIKIGLITNELLTNAIKHGFPKGKKGQINVILKALENDQASLQINHTGIQATKDSIDRAKGLGIQLIRGLTKQIKGVFELSDGLPRNFTVTFHRER